MVFLLGWCGYTATCWWLTSGHVVGVDFQGLLDTLLTEVITDPSTDVHRSVDGKARQDEERDVDDDLFHGGFPLG